MKKRLQRLLSCAVLVALLAGVTPATASAAAGFTDVPAGHWAAAEIARAVELGLFQGETRTTFGLGHRMTRAAFVVVLGRFFGWETQTPESGVYSDVQNPSLWYYSAVETAYANGALTRQSDTFRPNDAITREEMAVMLIRALGYGTIAGLAQELPLPFTDVTTSSGYLSMAYELGLVSGTSGTTFSPDRTATREQAAVILMRLYDKLHAAEPEKIGIASGTEDLADLTGYGTVAVDAGRLIYAGGVSLTQAMDKETETAVRAEAQAAGAKTLLYVAGGVSALRGTAETTAAMLAQAVENGGYDGLFIDLAKLQDQQKTNMTELTAALDQALGEGALYVMAEAPAWQGTSYGGYDYAALGQTADRLVLRIAPYTRKVNDFPTGPLEPLEEVYYALGELRDTVPGEKLSLLLTTTGAAWNNGKKAAALTGTEVDRLLSGRITETYYSSRYACAYLTLTVERQETVVWYLDRTALDQRTRMLGFFGVDQICLGSLNGVSQALTGQA